MFDSRTDAPRCITPNQPTRQHLRRLDATWMVKGVEVVRPAKPALTKREAITEGLSDLLDVWDMEAIANDGIDCEAVSEYGDAPWWRTPHTSESPLYDVRIAAEVNVHQRAKRDRALYEAYRAERMNDPAFDSYTGERPLMRPSGFIRANTRQRTRR